MQPNEHRMCCGTHLSNSPTGGGNVIRLDSVINNSHVSASLDSTSSSPRFNQNSFAYCMLYINSHRILKQIKIHLLSPPPPLGIFRKF